MDYYRVRLGKGNADAPDCFSGGYIGVNIGIHEDLSGRLPDHWRPFNVEWAPRYIALHPGKSRIAAGLACGALWLVARGMQVGELVLGPTKSGWRVGRVGGDYRYVPGAALPHQRPVEWLPGELDRATSSVDLKRSDGAHGTVVRVTAHRAEIDAFVTGRQPPALVASDPDVTDPVAFALERHLEDFLVVNWNATELGREFDLFRTDVEGEVVTGQQFPADGGAIDLLAISKDRKRLLVIELKKGRASDVVVGQVLRYMGYVIDEIAESGQSVEGMIIALEDDMKLRRALVAAAKVSFYRYEVSFQLRKAR